MKVLLVNVDCKWNLALRRMHAYYERQGADVESVDLGYGFYPHKKRATIDGRGYDLVAVSNVFEENAFRVEVAGCANVQYGGIGSRNSHAVLPQAIEQTPPKYFEGEDTAHGYITRGCVRNCYFCKVPGHEGKLRPYNSVQEIVGGFKKAVFHDNNILAWGGACDALSWLVENGVRYQFNQGLDLRLVTEESLALLAASKYIGEYVFALDDVAYIGPFEGKLDMAKRHIPQPWKLKFFVYVNADMEPSDTVRRVEWLRENECLPYIMRDRNVKGCAHERFYTDLAAWCNQPGLFKKMDFDSFLDRRHPKNASRRLESSAAWHGQEPNLCEACWQPALELFNDEGTAVCGDCLDIEQIGAIA